MAFGAPVEKNANAGAPVVGVKLAAGQKFDYHLPGHDYHRFDVTLLGIHPGILMARLDGSQLPLPGDTARAGGGIRAPRATPKSKKVETAKGVLESDIDEVLAEPTDARNRKVIAAGYKAAYVSPDDPTLLVCPPENLTGMFVEAAKCWPRTGLTRASGGMVVVSACNDSDVIPFLNPETDKPLRFDSKARVVEHPVSSRNPPPAGVLVLLYKAKSSTGKRILTARTYLPAWKLKFRLAFDAATFEAIGDRDPIEMFRLNVLAYAGGYIGLGSWRPGAPKGPGPFGRYQLVAFDRVKA